MSGQAAADAGERAYWGYEMELKRLETQIGSMVGGDGAIYAIRRPLWRTLPEDAINDFLNPLQIVEAGWRGVYEPEAVCYEETSGGFKSEYKRRVRIVSRSWRAVFQAPRRAQPVPGRPLQLVPDLAQGPALEHRALRAAGGGRRLDAARRSRSCAWPVPALAAIARRGRPGRADAGAGGASLSMAAYFAVINAASLVGVVKGTVGRVSGVWSTPREQAGRRRAPWSPVGPLFLVGGDARRQPSSSWAPTSAGCRHGALSRSGGRWARSLYVYVLYPLLLSLLRVVARRPIKVDAIEPTVCLFIAANDEAAVIEAKLDNALALDYPADKLEIVVASDGSVDGTNEIVARFATARVARLAHRPVAAPRQDRRDQPRAGAVSCEIVVFSDANTFLDATPSGRSSATSRSEEVGCVSGDVALVGDRALLAKSEDLYYRYERWIQHAESDIGSMIGADGALYAIRRAALLAAARRHHPRRHGDSDGDRAGRRPRRVRAEARAQEPGVGDRRARSSRARPASSPARCSSWPGPTARCRCRRRR